MLDRTGDDTGATAAEYAVMASLIAVVVATAVGLLGQSVLAIFASAAAAI